MAFLPMPQLFDKPEELVIEGEKVRDDPHRMPNLVRFLRVEGHTEDRLGAALQHVLRLFIETGRDCVVRLEDYEQGWQRWTVVATLFQKVP